MSASSMTVRRPNLVLFVLTLILGFMLMLFPLPLRVIWLRPAWLLIIMVYWLIMFPSYFGIGLVWIMGIFLDVLYGSLLGEHALAMTLAMFMILRIRTRFRFFPIAQQCLAILAMVVIYQVVLFCIQGFLGQPPTDSLYWWAPVTSMMLWPWVFSMLHHCNCRFTAI